MAYRRNSFDSGHRPLTDVRYQQAPYGTSDYYYNPNEQYATAGGDAYKDYPTSANQYPSNDKYGTGGDPYASHDNVAVAGGAAASGQYYPSQSQHYLPARPAKKKGTSKWIKIGIPVAVIVIAAAVVAAIFAIRAHNNASASGNTTSSGGSSGGGPGSQNDIGVLPTGVNSWFLPAYPSTTNQALFTSPTFAPAQDAALSWPSDPYTFPSPPSPTQVRPDRPRIIAPAYKWAALPNLVQNDPYMKMYHNQILSNASQYYQLPPVLYFLDGDSGILDVCRQVKERIKAFGYAYRMTNDTKWADRAWVELQNAAGNGTSPWGDDPTDRWNSGHFLDVAECTSGFSIGYDWLYDYWSDAQKESIRFTIIKYGLTFGVGSFTGGSYGWWTGTQSLINGNWNCVCNAGLTIGALSILNDDTSGIAEQILGYTIPNAKNNCVWAVSSDGTWQETANYWYFGTTGHAELASSLLVATGSDYGVLTDNPYFNLTGEFHMYVFGMTSLFNYGDHGPNKYSATANSLMLYATVYDNPTYMLYQRDAFDARSDTNAMFWYDPTVQGAWWDGLPLDHHFSNESTGWASMRSSWTEDDGLYIAMKASMLIDHQTHGDLDCGDFVLDALGTRWAGELGSGNYLSTGYFSNETQDSDRWLYYRKRTEGQNTILLGAQNQLSEEAMPVVTFQSSDQEQGSSTVLDIPSNSTAFFVADISTAYGSGNTVQRGIRMINSRRQVLLQDDITSSLPIMWRMHTNATVVIDSTGTQATLTLDGQTLIMQILAPTSGATFTMTEAVRLDSDPPLPAGQVDQPNPGVTVVVINLPAGNTSLQVLFSPQWSDLSASDYQTPPNVPIGQWSLTSHNPS